MEGAPGYDTSETGAGEELPASLQILEGYLVALAKEGKLPDIGEVLAAQLTQCLPEIPRHLLPPIKNVIGALEKPKQTFFTCNTPLGTITYNSTHRLATSPFKPDEKVLLSPKEGAVLKTLIINPEAMVPAEKILREVWGGQSVESSQYLRLYVRYLRKKLGPVIYNVYGEGYSLTSPSPQNPHS